MAVNYIDTIKDAIGNTYEIHAHSSSIDKSQIKSSAVTSSQLSTSAVTTGKISAGAVTSAKLASDVLSMIQNNGVATLNTFTGAVSIMPGNSAGTIKVATSSEYSNISVTGLGTAAFSSASSFASAYNYVKTVNGSAPDASGNVSVAGGSGAGVYTVVLGEPVDEDAVYSAIQNGMLIRCTKLDDDDNKNYCYLDEWERTEVQGGYTLDLYFKSLLGQYGASVIYSNGDWTNTSISLAPTSSPHLSGIPTAPTASTTVRSSQIATTDFVHSILDGAQVSAPAVTYTPASSWSVNNVGSALDSLKSSLTSIPASTVYTNGSYTVSQALQGLEQSVQNLETDTTYLTSSVSTIQSKLSSLSAEDISYLNGTVQDGLDQLGLNKAPLLSPAFQGVITASTPASTATGSQVATASFVKTITNTKANIASPAFTGTPTAPTPLFSTLSTSQIATTAFVQNAISNAVTRIFCQAYTGSTTSAITSESNQWFTRELLSTNADMAFNNGLIYYNGGIRTLISGIYNLRAGMYMSAHSSAATGIYLFKGTASSTATELYGIQTRTQVPTIKECQVTTHLDGGEAVWVKGRCSVSMLSDSTIKYGTCYLYAELIKADSGSSSGGSGGGDEITPSPDPVVTG